MLVFIHAFFQVNLSIEFSCKLNSVVNQINRILTLASIVNHFQGMQIQSNGQ